MFIRKFLFICVASLCLVGVTFAQSGGVFDYRVVPLRIEPGVPFDVVLTQTSPSRLNEPVHGKLMESIYAFDREVIPAGAEVLGKITAIHPVRKWKRTSLMLRGDFTPMHDAEITFDTIVLANGSTIRIETSAAATDGVFLRFDNGKTRGFTTDKPQGPSALHGLLWSLSPYHPQNLSTGATYEVTLLKPLELGSALLRGGAWSLIGSEPATGSMVYARLITPIDSKTARPGMVIRAVSTYPLFSADHRLLLPVGSTLWGEVAEAHAASQWSHGGDLVLKFRKIEPPLLAMPVAGKAIGIEGRLTGFQTNLDAVDTRIAENGRLEVVRTKQRFLAPAFSLFGALPTSGFHSASLGGAFTQAYTGDVISKMVGGRGGIGLPAGIASAMVPPIGMGFSAYGLARSVYSNLIGRGRDIALPMNTSIEVRLDSVGEGVLEVPSNNRSTLPE